MPRKNSTKATATDEQATPAESEAQPEPESKAVEVQPYDPKAFVTQSVAVSDIKIDPNVQVRDGLSKATIDQYEEALKNGANFPPVILFKENETYTLSDGAHRLEANKRLKKRTVKARVYSGGPREAWIYAATNNVTHGATLTTNERRRVATAMLRDPEWSTWSDRSIALRAGLSHQTVSRTRADLKAQDEAEKAATTAQDASTAASVSGPLDQIEAADSEPETRKVERGGTTYEMAVAPIAEAGASRKRSKKADDEEQEVDEGSTIGRDKFLAGLSGMTQIVGWNDPEKVYPLLTVADMLRVQNELGEVKTWLDKWLDLATVALNMPENGTSDAELESEAGVSA